MNRTNKVLVALFALMNVAAMGAMNNLRPGNRSARLGMYPRHGSSSSSSTSQLRSDDALAKDEQEALDAAIAASLMENEFGELNFSRVQLEEADAAYAWQLQMEEDSLDQSPPSPGEGRHFLGRPTHSESPNGSSSGVNGADVRFSVPRSQQGAPVSHVPRNSLPRVGERRPVYQRGGSPSAEYLPLLPQYDSRAVFHIKVRQLDAFSCGYNVLFNAANFEHHCGFSNPAHDYSLFQQRVLSYLTSQGHNSKAASTNDITDYLARNILHLQPFYHLHMRDSDRLIGPIIRGGVRILYSGRPTEHEIQRMFKKEVENRERIEMQNIKALLNQNSSAVIHFLCYVTSRGEPHGILVSLLQDPTGRGLYIFDNINEPLAMNRESARYIEYLCSTFDVSLSGTFMGPELPALWPSLAGLSRGR